MFNSHINELGFVRFRGKASYIHICNKLWGRRPEGYGSPWRAASNLVGLEASLIPIDINDPNVDRRYKIAYDVLKKSKQGGLLLDMRRRQSKFEEIFNKLAYKYNGQLNLFELTCASRPQGLRESGLNASQVRSINNVWYNIRDQAIEEEYNDTVSQLLALADSMRQVQERGDVMSQAVKKAQALEVKSEVKPTFRYTKSGVPLMVLGCQRCE